MDKITVHKFETNQRNEWEAFVANSNNGTMFHMLTFLDYHPEGKFEFEHLCFRRNGKLIAVLPGGLTNKGETFWSPVGASYGGIVTNDLPFSDSLAIVDAMMEHFRNEKVKDIFLIPPPSIYSTKFSQHIEYAMLYRKFDFELHYISHAIDLRNFDKSLLNFDKTARKTIHKILREKKLTISESSDYATFNDILIENKARHNVRPTHTLEDMLRLRELMPENLRLLMVEYNGKPIAGSLLFLCNPNVVLCFYNMLLYEYEQLRPIYLIMYETIRWAVEHNYKWVDIGVSQDTSAVDPMTPSLGLINFKERFDARGVLRSTYHLKID
ncbi:MAG: family N-acetyltransferase [Ignavibacteria bacterium]|nr:family N-acetyltransferase [Ignavibacteria bacterium]